MVRILLALLLASSLSCSRAKRAQMNQQSLDTDTQKTREEQGEDESLTGFKICTITESRASRVQYGVALKFPVKNCPVYCNANRIISQTIPADFLSARPNDDNTACACYTIIAPGWEEFMFGFTPKAVLAGSGDCSTKSCWFQYQELSTYVKQREMREAKPPLGPYNLQANDFLSSANHFSTSKEDGNEYSADCTVSDKSSYEVQMPNLVTMKNALELIGDTSGVQMLEGMATTEDPDDLDSGEIEELRERTDAKVVLTSTEAEGTELKDVVKEDVTQVDISGSMSEEEMFAALSAQNEETGGRSSSVDTTVLVDIIPVKRIPKVSPEKAVEVAPRLTTRKLVQPIMLQPKQGTCSGGAPAFSTYTDAVCGPIENEAQCRAMARTKGNVEDDFSAFTRDMEKTKYTDRLMGNQPLGCFMRRSDSRGPWHAFWNELGKHEKAATGRQSKKGKKSTVFEYRLLCGCYREVPEVDRDLVDLLEAPVAVTAPAEEALQEPIVEPQACEFKCKDGKACGDSCIPALDECTKAPGKACNVKVEELQHMKIVAEEAIEGGDLHQAMVNWYKEYPHSQGSDIAACGAHADALDRAECICRLANHWEQGENGKEELGVSPRDMQGECNGLMSEANWWGFPFTCSVVSKKKGRKGREKSCIGSSGTVRWGSTGGSSGGSASPMKLDLGDFFNLQ